jgi:fructose/tagatose bisphosphate aldolase
MHVLREVLVRAQTDGTAVAHFNVCDLALLKAVFDAARGT